MARKDPPGTIYVGDGITITAERLFGRDIVKIKITKRTAGGTKSGVVLPITYEVIEAHPVSEGMEYPHFRYPGQA